MEKKLLLLGLLHQQEMRGYQLKEFIDNNLALCTDLKKPTAYYLLDQMLKDGWVSVEMERESYWTMRKVYRLTDAGESAFQRLLRENLVAYSPVSFPGDIGLGFLDRLSTAESLLLLETQKNKVTMRLAELQSVTARANSMDLIFSHQVHHLQAEIMWLDQVMEIVKSKRQTLEIPGAPKEI